MHFLYFVKVPNWRFPTISSGDGGGSIFTISRRNLRTWFHVCAVTGDQSTRDVFSANFPSDYTELIVQVIPVKTCLLTTGSSFIVLGALVWCQFYMPILVALL